jgi:hypothetical protein
MLIMATPTPQDIELPGLQPNRAIAGYDLSAAARGSEALTKGGQTLGAGITQSAQEIAKTYTDQVKSQSIVAMDEALGKAVLARQKYQNRTDTDKFPDEHAAELRGILYDATKDLPNGPIKDHVVARIQIPFAHEIASVSEQARKIDLQNHAAARDGTANDIVGMVGPNGQDPLVNSRIDTFNSKVDDDVAQRGLSPVQGLFEKQMLAKRVANMSANKRIEAGDASGVLADTADPPKTDADVTNRILQVEGTGKNPASSAVGAGQFIDSTWLDVLRRNRPDLAQGRSDAELLALRADRGLGREMTDAYRRENAATLTRQGVEATPGAQYLAHFLGPGGAVAVLKADPSTPAVDALSKAVGPDKAKAMVAANPTVLGGQLVGSVQQWADKKMGGAQPGSVYSILTPEERYAIHARAESELQKGEVNDRAQFTQRFQDTVAEAHTAGTATNPLRLPDFIAHYGASEGPQHFTDYQAQLTLGQDIRAVDTMSPAQQSKLLSEDYKPEPGPGMAAAVQRQGQLAEAIKRSNAERNADPAQFAITRLPAVSESWSKLATAIHDPTQAASVPALARDYAIKTADEQRRIGIPEGSIEIAPKGYIADLNKKITTAVDSDDAQGRTALIGTIQHEAGMWGDAWPTVMRQMAPTAQPIVRAIAAGADPIAMTRLLSLGKDENPSKLLKEQNETKFKDVTNALNTEMAPFLGSLVGRQRDRDFGAYYGLGEKLASLYVRDGDDASTAAHKAFNALIGNRYEFRDTWRMPKSAGVSADDVQAGVEDAKLAVRNGALNIRPAINDIGLSDNRADSFSKFARDGKWVTSADQSGLNLVYDDNFIRTEDGKPLLLSWQQLVQMSKDHKARVAVTPPGLTAEDMWAPGAQEYAGREAAPPATTPSALGQWMREHWPQRPPERQPQRGLELLEEQRNAAAQEAPTSGHEWSETVKELANTRFGKALLASHPERIPKREP